MSVPNEHVKRAVDAAKLLEQQGYFAKAKTGDARGASYFARMVASRVNPHADTGDWGWLKKTGGGFNVEGYADGAIVFGNDPSNRNNVLKIVTQVGSSDPNAIQIGSAVQARRESDVWESPVPLPDSLQSYFDGSPILQPTPVFVVDRAEFMDEGAFLHRFYLAPEGLHREFGLWIDGHPDWEGIAAWLFDVYLTARVAGKTRELARALYVAQIRDSGEWKLKHPNG